MHSVAAATCTISADTVVDASYISSNSCTAIDIQGNVSTPWVGTVDLGGGTVTVKTGYTMTMGTNGQMVLGASDDVVIETGAVISHLAESVAGIQTTAINVTVTGSIDANAKGCRALYGPNVSMGICAAATSGAGSGSYGGGGSGYYVGTSVVYGSSTVPLILGSGGWGCGRWTNHSCDIRNPNGGRYDFGEWWGIRVRRIDLYRSRRD